MVELQNVVLKDLMNKALKAVKDDFNEVALDNTMVNTYYDTNTEGYEFVVIQGLNQGNFTLLDMHYYTQDYLMECDFVEYEKDSVDIAFVAVYNVFDRYLDDYLNTDDAIQITAEDIKDAKDALDTYLQGYLEFDYSDVTDAIIDTYKEFISYLPDLAQQNDDALEELLNTYYSGSALNPSDFPKDMIENEDALKVLSDRLLDEDLTDSEKETYNTAVEDEDVETLKDLALDYDVIDDYSDGYIYIW